MKHNVLFLTLSYFCIAIQFCSAMKNKNLPLVKTIQDIECGSTVKYGNEKFLITNNTKGCKSINISSVYQTTINLNPNLQNDIVINPNQKQVVLVKHDEINIYDIQTGVLEDRLYANTDTTIKSCCFDRENNIFISVYNCMNQTSTIIKNPREDIYAKTIFFKGYIQWTVSGNNKILCVVGNSGSLSVYDTINLQQNTTKQIDLKNIPSLCSVSNEGMAAIVDEFYSKIFLIDLKEDNLSVKTISYPNGRCFTNSMYFLNNKTLAVQSNKAPSNTVEPQLDYWNIITGRLTSSTQLQKGDCLWDIDTKNKQAIIYRGCNNTYGIYSLANDQ